MRKAGVWTQIEIADYQLVDPRVRPFKIDYWQLVATWIQGNLYHCCLHTWTIWLPTHRKSSVTWQLVDTIALQWFSLVTNWWWWEMTDRLGSKFDMVEVAIVCETELHVGLSLIYQHNFGNNRPWTHFSIIFWNNGHYFRIIRWLLTSCNSSGWLSSLLLLNEDTVKLYTKVKYSSLVYFAMS